MEDIKRGLEELAAEDKEVGAIFKSNSEVEGNSLVKKVREEVLEEFAKLMEIAILQKSGEREVSKEMLEKRYGELTSPKTSSKVTQLNIIDEFLKKEMNKQFLKESFDAIKPYFLHKIDSIVKAELKKMAEAISRKAQLTHQLELYLLHKEFPNFADTEIMRRLSTFNTA